MVACWKAGGVKKDTRVTTAQGTALSLHFCFRVSTEMTDAGGVVEISRWCKPPVSTTKCGEPRQGRRNGRHTILRSPGRGSNSIFATNRWFAPPANLQSPFGISRSPSALILDMQCVLVGLRSKISINTYSNRGWERGNIKRRIALTHGLAHASIHPC
jgi:hypothetical protein